MKKLAVLIFFIILATVSGRVLGQSYKKNATRYYIASSSNIFGIRANITNRDPALRAGQMTLHRVILSRYATSTDQERFIEFGWLEGIPGPGLPYQSAKLIVIYGIPNVSSSFIITSITSNNFAYEIRRHGNGNNVEPLCPEGGPFHSINFTSGSTITVLTKLCKSHTHINQAHQAMWGGEILTPTRYS